MIQKNAILVIFNAAQWSARKLDRSVTNEINNQKNASQDAGRYNKLLMSKEETEAITKIVSKGRKFHYENTLVWSENNERLLTIGLYFKYIEEMIKMQSEFQSVTEKFYETYPQKILAEKSRLGDLYNEADYPTVDEIRRKFRFEFKFMPVPENNLHVELSESEINNIRASVEDEINKRVEGAVKEVWGRINDVLTHMRDKLKDADAIFRDSLFGNMQELIELLPSLNITNDPKIGAIIKEMQSIKVTPEEARNSPELRKVAVQQVDDILNNFKSYFS